MSEIYYTSETYYTSSVINPAVEMMQLKANCLITLALICTLVIPCVKKMF